MSAERDLVENDEEHLIKQMDIDTKKAIIELHEERERQKIQNDSSPQMRTSTTVWSNTILTSKFYFNIIIH